MSGTETKKVALITGATKGIGKAIAEKLSAQGYRVCGCGQDETALRAMRESGFDMKKVDIGRREELYAWVDEVHDRWGRVDAVVNNAAMYPQVRLADMADDEWDAILRVNLTAVFALSKRAAHWMSADGIQGTIVNAASFASLIPSVNAGAYAATKSAVYSITRTFAAELAPKGIRVNGYIPGVIETDLTRPVIEKSGDAMLNQIALRRFGTPEEAAEAVWFLMSPAASYITGSFIEISGGKLCVQNPGAAWR